MLVKTKTRRAGKGTQRLYTDWSERRPKRKDTLTSKVFVHQVPEETHSKSQSLMLTNAKSGDAYT